MKNGICTLRVILKTPAAKNRIVVKKCCSMCCCLFFRRRRYFKMSAGRSFHFDFLIFHF